MFEYELTALDGAYAVDKHPLTERLMVGFAWMTRDDSFYRPRNPRNGASWLRRPAGARKLRKRRLA